MHKAFLIGRTGAGWMDVWRGNWVQSSPMKGFSRSGRGTVYLMAICLVAALGGLLFGFDTAVVSGTVFT